MKRINKKANLISLFTILLFAPLTALFAQSKADSLFYFQHQLRANSWQVSKNPIFLSYGSLPQFAEAGIFYSIENGRFKRPQDYLKGQRGGIKASGITKYKNWQFLGDFQYQKLFNDSVKYSNVARPFSGNPFITADLQGGNWKGDQIRAGLNMTAPAIGKLTLGLSLEYEAEQSARDNHPRPLYRFMDYRLMPAIGFNFNKQNTVSITGGFTGSRQVIETGMYSRDNAMLYDLRGYGTAVPTTIVSAERFVNSSGWESGGDYLHKSGNTSILIGARYAKRTENVNEGVQKNDPSLSLLVGSLDETKGSVYLSYQNESKSGMSASATAWFRDGLGYDGYFNAVNPTYYLSGLDSRFSWYSLSSGKSNLALNLYPGLSYANYAESVAQTDWTTLMAYTKISMALRYKVSSKLALTGTPLIGYYKNLQKEIFVGNASIISGLITEPDFIFSTADFFVAEAAILADLNFKQSNYRWSLSYGNKVSTPQQMSGNNRRTLFQTSLSIIF